jgi:hypothetical protein
MFELKKIRQPRFGDWAFNVDRGESILKKWNKIPENIDVLISKKNNQIPFF